MITREDIYKNALAELEAERFRRLVDAEKQRLLTHKPWHVRLFPWRVRVIKVAS